MKPRVLHLIASNLISRLGKQVLHHAVAVQIGSFHDLATAAPAAISPALRTLFRQICGRPSRRRTMFSGKVYNIACGKNYSLLETYYLIALLIGFDKEPAFAPPRNGDIQHSLASILKAKQDFGYVPNVGIVEGLSRTIDSHALKAAAARELATADL